MTTGVKREEVEFVAEVRKKRHREGYIISLKGESGGPVLGGKNLDKLKEDFREALNASVAITSLFAFKEDDEANSASKKDEGVKRNEGPEVRFEGDDLTA